MARRDHPIVIVCSCCGSKDVSRDAWARWDEAAQQWTLGAVFDYSFCQTCECERRLEERPLLPTSAILAS